MQISKKEDCGNIIQLEHLNFNTSSKELAKDFYGKVLGLQLEKKEPSGNQWFNMSLYQFHIGARLDNCVEVLDGAVGLVYPDLKELKKLLNGAPKILSDMKFTWKEYNKDSLISHHKMQHLEIICPWGNKFIAYEDNKFRGEMGISFVECNVNKGTAIAIGEFYKEFLGAVYEKEEFEDVIIVHVACGIHQQIIFRESPHPVKKFDGHHVCIYINNFSECYHKFYKAGILWNEKRFSDRCETFEVALKYHQFRFQDIVNNNGEVIYQLQHEVRSLYHPLFMIPGKTNQGDWAIIQP